MAATRSPHIRLPAPPGTEPPSGEERPQVPDRGWGVLLPLFFLLVGLVYCIGLGATPLFDGDEPRYAQACREMLARHDWLTPTFNGELRFQKPILIYWLILGSYRLFGSDEGAARLPAALAAVGLAALVLLFTHRRLGRGPALLAGAAVAFNIQSIVLGRASTPDALLCLVITGSLFAFYSAYTAEMGRRKRGYLLFWALAGVGMLTKGPVGFGLPVLVAGLFVLLERRLAVFLREGCILPGLLLAGLIAGPWYAAMVALHGRTFTDFFFLREHLGRFSQPMEGHAGPVYYYLAALIPFFLPWLGLALFGGWMTLRPPRRMGTESGAGDEDAHRLGRFALLWAGLVLGIFSLSRTKLPHYIYPAYPALALLAALGWRALASGGLSRRLQGVGLGLAGVLFLALGGVAFAALSLAARLGFPERVGGEALAVFLLAALAGGAGLWLLGARRAGPSVAVLGGASGLLCVFLAHSLTPPAHEFSCGGLVRLARLAAATDPGSHLAVWKSDFSAVVYYSGKTGVEQNTRMKDLAGWRRSGRPVLLVCRTRALRELAPYTEQVAVDGSYALVRVTPAPGRPAPPPPALPTDAR